MTTILLDGFRSLLFTGQFFTQILEILHLHHPKDVKLPTKTLLAPCKILISFLLQAYEYAKFQYQSKDSWAQTMTKVYLCTCCMSSDVSNNFFSLANNVKQNNAPKTIVTPPVLWLQHKELRIKIEHFSDAPMHMHF